MAHEKPVISGLWLTGEIDGWDNQSDQWPDNDQSHSIRRMTCHKSDKRTLDMVTYLVTGKNSKFWGNLRADQWARVMVKAGE